MWTSSNDGLVPNTKGIQIADVMVHLVSTKCVDFCVDPDLISWLTTLAGLFLLMVGQTYQNGGTVSFSWIN